MEQGYLKAAHEAARFNKNRLKKDSRCGCFCCLEVFSPSDITEWCAGEFDGEEVTALCPFCGVDSILSESSGFPLTKAFLKEMQSYYFGDDSEDENAGFE